MNLTPPLYQTSRGTPRDLGSLLSLESQGFGENVEFYQREFGVNGHNGLDWGCAEGTPIYASHDGTALNGMDGSKGMGVVLVSPTHKTIYWHLSSYAVDNGTAVKRGQIIGFSGNTGKSTGPHLHFGLKLMYNGEVLNRDNGFDGAVDPTPYMVWAVPQETMTQEVVRNLYRLAFYREPTEEESTYWTGKDVAAFLKAAIADRAAFLSHE